MTNPTHVTCNHCGMVFCAVMDLCFKCTHCGHAHFLYDSRGRFPGYYTGNPDCIEDLRSKTGRAARLAFEKSLGNPNKGYTVERTSEDMIVCKEIRKVKGGYIVEMMWPYVDECADRFGSYGEVVCATFGEVVALLTRAADEEGYESQKESCCGN